MIKIERIITPENFNPDAELTADTHKVYICKKESKETAFKLENTGSVSNPEYEKEQVDTQELEDKTTDIKCSCGEKFDSVEIAKNHLNQFTNPEKASIKSDVAYRNLKGVKLHGFKFLQLSAHNSSILFTHEELNLSFYATPNYHENGKMSISVRGGLESIIQQPLDGRAVKEIDTQEQLTVKEYLEEVRDFVEKDLLSKNRREELGIGENQ